MSSTVRSILNQTVPHDKKNFPATNQAHYCWQKYNEFVLCLKKKNGDEDACKEARHAALSICLEDMVEEWDDQRAEGNFLGVQEKPEAHDEEHH
mmetsp:Transcript_28805/g.72519  ORF Transcript_28805/g.72519 Transcript_28805/m.72519 type:complete len:94 (-) Transcript_28805:95-376(-)